MKKAFKLIYNQLLTFLLHCCLHFFYTAAHTSLMLLLSLLLLCCFHFFYAAACTSLILLLALLLHCCSHFSYAAACTSLMLLLALCFPQNCHCYAPPPVVTVLCSRLYLHRSHSFYTLQFRHVQHIHIQSPPELDASNSHNQCHKHTEHVMNMYKNMQETCQELDKNHMSESR